MMNLVHLVWRLCALSSLHLKSIYIKKKNLIFLFVELMRNLCSPPIVLHSYGSTKITPIKILVLLLLCGSIDLKVQKVIVWWLVPWWSSLSLVFQFSNIFFVIVKLKIGSYQIFHDFDKLTFFPPKFIFILQN